MDGVRFDALARLFGSVADRRAAARSLVGGAVGALGLVAGHQAEAKKKKKCKKPKVKCGKKCCAAGQACIVGACAVPCRFTTVGTVMTLQANCRTASTIDIPNGVTLDGDGKTVTLVGPATAAAAIRALGGVANLENLTVDGSGQTGSCGGQADAVVFGNTSGQITNVTVRNIRCGSGITASVGQGAQGPHTVDVEDATVQNVNHDDGNQVAAIGFFADTTGPQLTASVSDSTIQNAFEGVLLQGNTVATVDGNTIGAGNAGIHSTDGADTTATNNTVNGAQFGMGADFGSVATGRSALAASGNVIVGPGAITGPTYGVAFFTGNEGSASFNTVSNFFDSAGNEGCGIFVAADAGAVTIGSNTFPNPPGNEQDVCDNRP